MTTLLLIRHGQSQANLTRRFAGQIDAPLTELGIQQAQRTAEFVKAHYQVDKVYASDLSRAARTGQAVADELGLPLKTDPSLREINAGQWEGIPFEQLAQDYPEDYGVWLADIGNSRPVGGESVAELAQRIEKALTAVALENPGKTVAVAIHAIPIRSIQWRLSGEPLSYMTQIPWVTNASVTELFFESGVFRLGKVAQDEHLADLITTLPKTV